MAAPQHADPRRVEARIRAFQEAHAGDEPSPRIFSPAAAVEAGRRHARERGDRLSDAQIAKAAALVRPYLPRILAAQEAQEGARRTA